MPPSLVCNSLKELVLAHDVTEFTVKDPTHIEGNLLDQAHLRDKEELYRFSVELHTKYYTDHRGVALLMKRYTDIFICNMHCIHFNLGTDRLSYEEKTL